MHIFGGRGRGFAGLTGRSGIGKKPIISARASGRRFHGSRTSSARKGSEQRTVQKLILEAEATSFQDPEKGGWEPVGPSGRKPCARKARQEASGGYTLTCRRAEK